MIIKFKNWGDYMLSYLKIQNFKSILDLTINLSYDEHKAPNNYQQLENLPFLEIDKWNRFVPVLALYGANGAGKTTILKAFRCLQVLLEGDHRLKSKLPYSPNKINPKYNATTFEISTYINKQNYVYVISFNASEILYESFICYKQDDEKKKHPITLFKIEGNNYDFTGIATKAYNNKRLKEIYNVECKDNNRQWLPFVCCLEHNYSQLNLSISFFCRYIVKDLVYYDSKIPLPMAVELLAGDDNDENLKTAFYEITNELKKLDIDIERITMSRQQQDFNNGIPSFLKKPTFVKRIDENTFTFDTVSTYHIDVNKKEVDFDFSEESDGTKTLSGLLGFCLFAFKNGKTVLVDELERSLHPFLLREIIGMFKNKKYNTANAQLIFTAHNTDILDDRDNNHLMRVSEVAVINKTKETGSTIKRISETNARNVSNFRKRYLAGNYKGLPNINN